MEKNAFYRKVVGYGLLRMGGQFERGIYFCDMPVGTPFFLYPFPELKSQFLLCFITPIVRLIRRQEFNQTTRKTNLTSYDLKLIYSRRKEAV